MPCAGIWTGTARWTAGSAPPTGPCTPPPSPTPPRVWGCPDTDDADTEPGPCRGYELTASLDFDTDGSGGANAADAYWNGGKGWEPIGVQPEDPNVAGANNVRYRAEFHGNGNVIDNLFINRTGVNDDPGLFGAIGAGGKVIALGLRNASVTGGDTIGHPSPH